MIIKGVDICHCLESFQKRSEKPVITFARLCLCLVKGRIDKRYAEKTDCCWPRSQKFRYGVIKIVTVDRLKSMSGNPIHVWCQAIKLKLPDYLVCTENSNNVDVAWHSNSLFLCSETMNSDYQVDVLKKGMLNSTRGVFPKQS